MSPLRASLSQKMILAFAAVIALSLILASGAFAYILREYQADRERDRLEQVALSASGLVIRALRNGIPLQEVESQLDQVATAAHARILLLSDRGVVVHDSDQDKLTDRSFSVPLVTSRRAGIYQGTLDTTSGEQVYAVVPFGQSGYRVAVLAPEQSLTNAWRDLLPRLSVAAIGALLVSIAIAWRLAASITRPLVQITWVSEEMARGHYEHQLETPETGDEVGRLATAFNAMAREVGRSHRAMRDLLANVSHDLRTPLTSIQGFAGALVDGTIHDRQGAHEAGRVIGEEAERMRHLIDDLLYLGRIESGEAVIEKAELDLADLVRASQRRFTFRAEETNTTLRLDVSKPVHVLGDPHRLAQVLDNLLDNAFKHTPAGGTITVSVGTVREPAARGRPRSPASAVLQVHNTGSLIPPDEIERVFERFYQLDKARVGKEGRGLGLAIAREIVQAHGGTIEAASTEGDGTSFVVSLPLVEAVPRPGLSSVEGVDTTRRTNRPVPARG